MLKLNKDGYAYISDRGIQYEILEGMTIGVEPRRTSDLIFIFLMDADFDLDNYVVGYLFGAFCFEKNLKEYEVYIKKMVDKFEEENFGGK